MEEYVKLTDGLIDIGLCPLVSYLYSIRDKIGNKAILYTGDGGDKMLGPLGFRSNIFNVQELLSYIIETDHVFALDEISSMLDIHEDIFREHLKNHFMRYPERTMEGKFAHFRVFERGFKWLFVGEDRNRLFLWSTTPFYSIHFFRASMKMSQRVKEYYLLYKDFLSSLNPVLSRIQYYNRLVPLSIPNRLLKFYLTAFEWLKTHFHEPGTTSIIKSLISEPPQEMSNETKKLMLKLLGQKGVFNSLDPTRMGETIIKEKNQMKLNILATLILHANLVKSSGNIHKRNKKIHD